MEERKADLHQGGLECVFLCVRDSLHKSASRVRVVLDQAQGRLSLWLVWVEAGAKGRGELALPLFWVLPFA